MQQCVFIGKVFYDKSELVGKISLVSDQVADEYYSSRAYESRIGAWASKQSEELKKEIN